MTNSPQSPLPVPGQDTHQAPAAGTAAAGGLGDLALPLRGARPKQALARFVKKYSVFSGRASRSEFWWVYLFVAIAMAIPYALVVIGMSIGFAWAAANPKVTELGVDPSTGEAITFEQPPGIMNHAPAAILIWLGLVLLVVVFLAVIVPLLALMVRRLHDVNMPGPLLFIALVPFAGPLIVLVFMLLEAKPEGARFDAVGAH
ncbi:MULTISPECIES: DUF805 domain-containing protein [unclassified Brevibacterium]|uniref:DUF805 domain-containing protein n=1 Tax=unclassified Brevibacterium TaxID=2614124 RepID=UPI0010F7B332|nr:MULTISPECIES: DUF805 domain-containing protein [unclassified Brevibacterium]MCM1012008.1 DUF805 domain-containing protein [Brevibacterium sp. XM4083]